MRDSRGRATAPARRPGAACPGPTPAYSLERASCARWDAFDVSSLGESWAETGLTEETFKSAHFELYDLDDDGRVTHSEWDRAVAFHGTPAG